MGQKILIIDDESGIVEAVTEYLAEEGYEVLHSDTGQGGVDLIRSQSPALVILDMKLPDMSGIDILRIAKTEAENVKVIVTTGYVDQKIIDQAEELGRDAFLQKPFDLEQLQNEINSVLGDA